MRTMLSAGTGRFPRPRVVVSACLGYEACRYDGRRLSGGFVRELAAHVDLVPVCPEVEIGLGVPRDPIRLVSGPDGVRLVQPSTGRDLTRRMDRFTGRFLDGLRRAEGGPDGFVLKSGSPSCGARDVSVHASATSTEAVARAAGRFAAAALKRFPGAAVEDEDRLGDDRIREHFLTKLFARAGLREVEAAGRMEALTDFHARHALILTAYHKAETRRLGRIAANPDGRAFAEVAAEYRVGLANAMRRPPRAGAIALALERARDRRADGDPPGRPPLGPYPEALRR